MTLIDHLKARLGNTLDLQLMDQLFRMFVKEGMLLLSSVYSYLILGMPVQVAVPIIIAKVLFSQIGKY